RPMCFACAAYWTSVAMPGTHAVIVRCTPACAKVSGHCGPASGTLTHQTKKRSLHGYRSTARTARASCSLMCREGSLTHAGRFIDFPLFQIETPELKQSSSAKARFGTLEEVVTGNWDRQRKGNPGGFQSCWARNMERFKRVGMNRCGTSKSLCASSGQRVRIGLWRS